MLIRMAMLLHNIGFDFICNDGRVTAVALCGKRIL